MDLNSPFNCITFNLQRATRSLVRQFELAARKSGLTSPQFTTLSLIAGHGQISITQLADRLGTDRTTLTRNLELLAKKGWIAPAAAKDARLHLWELTATGKQTLATALPVWQAFQAELVARIGAETAVETLTALRKL
jgi:DNA-binding MarR family transcriptional regulator